MLPNFAEELLESERRHRKEVQAAEAAALKAKQDADACTQAALDSAEKSQSDAAAALEEARCAVRMPNLLYHIGLLLTNLWGEAILVQALHAIFVLSCTVRSGNVFCVKMSELSL